MPTLPSQKKRLGQDYAFGLDPQTPTLPAPSFQDLNTPATPAQAAVLPTQNDLISRFFDYLSTQNVDPIGDAIKQREAQSINRSAAVEDAALGGAYQRFQNQPNFTPEGLASRAAAGFASNIAPQGRGVITQRDQLFLPQALPTINYDQAAQLERNYNFPFTPGARGGMTPYGPIMAR